MAAQLNEKEVVDLRNILHKVADFIAMFETADEKLAAREKALDDRFNQYERVVNQHLYHIETTLKQHLEFMDAIGVARWRLAAENALKEGKEHLQALERVTQEYLAYTKESCERLDRATAYTVKGISQAVSSFNPEEFRRLANESSLQIKQACTSSLQKVTDLIKWFNWKNLGVLFSLTLVVTMVTGLYLNDEWPWETHSQVMQQRNLASAVATAWPSLSSSDQQTILRDTNKDMG